MVYRFYYFSDGKRFPCLHSLIYKQERGWENSRQLCNPEMKWKVCITVENSLNPSRVYLRLFTCRKKVFYCSYNVTFPRKKAKHLVLDNDLKRNSYQLWSLLQETCTRNQFLFCNKDAFQKYWFFSPEMSGDEGMGKLSKCGEFSTQKLFQISAFVISEPKAKHLDATTMFTYSHANTPLGQSERLRTKLFYKYHYGSVMQFNVVDIVTWFIRTYVQVCT